MAGPMSSPGHLRKKPFQPSITSYLHSRDGKDSEVRRTTSPLSPPLPEETQASLLSVGMRVRKSVPEGYKTHKTLDDPGFPFPSTAPATSLSRARTTGEEIGRARELTPFCGLHKTGGLAMQQFPPSSAPPAFERSHDEDIHDMPTMTWSQSTMPTSQDSFISMYATDGGAARKRTYEEDIEDDMDAFFEEMDDMSDARVSQSHDRPIARMRTQMGKGATAQPASILTGTDFPEATFLAPLEGMETDEAF